MVTQKTDLIFFKSKLQEYINSESKCLYNFEDYEQRENELDQLIGLRNREYETLGKFPNEKESYTDNEINMCALNTSYADWFLLLSRLSPSHPLVDLGSGYSKGSIISSLYPQLCKVESFEYIKERVDSTRESLKENNLESNHIHHCDLRDFFPKAKRYFLYLPTGELVHSILRRIEKLAKSEEIEIYAIESHGDLINFIAKESWLDQQVFTKIKTPRHDNNIYLFKSKNVDTTNEGINEREKHLAQIFDQIKSQEVQIPPYQYFYDFKNSAQDFDQILFQDERGEWIGDLKGAQLCLLDNKRPHLELAYPKRRIPYTVAKKLIRPNESLRESISRRHKDEGIRKIYIRPRFFIETI